MSSDETTLVNIVCVLLTLPLPLGLLYFARRLGKVEGSGRSTKYLVISQTVGSVFVLCTMVEVFLMDRDPDVKNWEQTTAVRTLRVLDLLALHGASAFYTLGTIERIRMFRDVVSPFPISWLRFLKIFQPVASVLTCALAIGGQTLQTFDQPYFSVVLALYWLFCSVLDLALSSQMMLWITRIQQEAATRTHLALTQCRPAEQETLAVKMSASILSDTSLLREKDTEKGREATSASTSKHRSSSAPQVPQASHAPLSLAKTPASHPPLQPPSSTAKQQARLKIFGQSHEVRLLVPYLLVAFEEATMVLVYAANAVTAKSFWVQYWTHIAVSLHCLLGSMLLGMFKVALERNTRG
ncbi:hypothetical protein HDU87_008724 [Geranomyces variabilis]|uniref:Uncharacterized protein n=1 Tax=Geranomyces variabilis TaxID=109894 RepID=A0AAD5TDR3_9FUNG|nr:hypothetical protein HDU87_008724 [Geranomyces variabilis]